MTQFAPRELCERLAKMGCLPTFYNIGDSHREWCFLWVEDKTNPILQDMRDSYLIDKFVYAFQESDFTASTERARENVRILWEHTYILREGPDYHRHAIINLPEGKVWDYIEKTMKRGTDGKE